eukprot:6488718-Heterocapsa_arctica.AAC.1
MFEAQQWIAHEHPPWPECGPFSGPDETSGCTSIILGWTSALAGIPLSVRTERLPGSSSPGSRIRMQRQPPPPPPWDPDVALPPPLWFEIIDSALPPLVPCHFH